MPMEEDPEVGAVYEDAEGKTFEVRAFDENEGTVQLEYADGTLETIDLDAWYELDLTLLESADEESDEDDIDEDYEERDEDDLDEDDDYGEDEEE
jgi:hypothetical protein